MHTAISADQVSSRGNVNPRKNHGAQIADHHNAPRPLHRGRITIEQLVERYEVVHIEQAWTVEGEGYLVWLGDPPQAGKACSALQHALAEAVLACGGEVSNAVDDSREERKLRRQGVSARAP